MWLAHGGWGGYISVLEFSRETELIGCVRMRVCVHIYAHVNMCTYIIYTYVKRDFKELVHFIVDTDKSQNLQGESTS